jgi:hypothetical protein
MNPAVAMPRATRYVAPAGSCAQAPYRVPVTVGSMATVAIRRLASRIET